MKEDLTRFEILLDGITFQFEYRIEGIIKYKSIESIMITGGFYDFTISVFDNESPFFLYSDFGFLSREFKVFEITQCLSIMSPDVERLYHKKYDEE